MAPLGHGLVMMLTETLNRWWRVVATGFCFFVFALVGMVLNMLVFPLLRVCVWRRSARARWAKHLMHYLFRFFVGLMSTVGVLRLEVRGLEKLKRPGLLIVANHPSLVDVLFLISLIKQADCVVNGRVRRNFFMRGTVRTTGYLCTENGLTLLRDAVASLHAGNSLIVFPEGSRTPLVGALPLQRGAAHVAIRCGVSITPVRIRCQPPMLTKGVPWYSVPVRPGNFVLEVCDDIPVARFQKISHSSAVAAGHLTDHLTDFFSLEIHRAAS
jgi:1-acyl-sn-glycerol-3-phosphate acyltransferase